MNHGASLHRAALSSAVVGLAGLVLGAGAPLRAASAIYVDAGIVEWAPGDGNCGLIEAIRNAQAATDLSRRDCEAGSDGLDVIYLADNAVYTLSQDYLSAIAPQPPPQTVPPPGPFRGYFPIALNSGRSDTASGLPPIDTAIVVDGRHATIERAAAPGTPPLRFFTVAGGELILSNLTLRGGATDLPFTAEGRGGAILVRSGSLVLESVNVMGNRATDGGGISVEGRWSRAEVNASFIHGNQAVGGVGGGILVSGEAVLQLTDSFVTANSAEDGGGIGIYASEGDHVALVASTVRGNVAGNRGGGIFGRSGGLRISDSEISHNEADVGGGLHAASRLVIEGATIRANRAIRAAGMQFGGSEFRVSRSVVEANVAGYKEAGLVVSRGDTTITDTTIRNNVSIDGPCGGLCNDDGHVLLERSAIHANRGGGIVNGYGTMTVVASTISGNYNSSNGGNGIFNQGLFYLRWSTVAGNHAGSEEGEGCGIVSSDTDGGLRLLGSIVAGHVGGQDCAGGDIVSEGWNLASDGSCPLSGPGDRPSTDPRLGPLADNGGPTWTHTLLDGSPAINAIARGMAGCGEGILDQRGLPRPLGDRCDIGAFER